MKDHERNCSLLFDEMKIKPGLVLSRARGKLIGFAEIGDINDELLEFERKFSGKERDLATHILAFMARGIFSHFNFPIAYFCSKGFNSDQLFPCVWEAIGVLESIRLKSVPAFVMVPLLTENFSNYTPWKIQKISQMME